MAAILLWAMIVVYLCWGFNDEQIIQRRHLGISREHLLALQRASVRHRARERLRTGSCTSTAPSDPPLFHQNHPESFITHSETRTARRRKRNTRSDAEVISERTPPTHSPRRVPHTLHFEATSTVLRYNGLVELPASNFTTEVWVKPAGGQAGSVRILGLYDTCMRHQNVSHVLWDLGLHVTRDPSTGDSRYARWQLQIRSWRSYVLSSVRDVRKIGAESWGHLAITYDGHSSSLYINGAKVGETRSTWGEIHSGSHMSGDEPHACLSLLIGSDDQGIHPIFRGDIGAINIYRAALSHEQISELHNRELYSFKIAVDVQVSGIASNDLITVSEEFYDLSNWDAVADDGQLPVLTESHFTEEMAEHTLALSVPPCGKTVCDDPEVIRSYTANPELRLPKTIRYRIINVANDDGSSPLVGEEQIALQHDAMKYTLNAYNISLRLPEVVVVTNSSLRRRKILHGCEVEKVGNGECDPECEHEVTGWDGGDCDVEMRWCPPESQGNDVCEEDCNTANHNWDGGDCCNGEDDVTSQCIDPQSTHRIYMGLREYKHLLGFENKKYVNVYFADWTSDIIGVSTFPWSSLSHTELGGIALKPQNFGLPDFTNNLIHELGHALGLWHTFYGVDELPCTDPCLEVMSSLELGDLCSDTYPTNRNTECEETNDEWLACALRRNGSTAYRNFMGYSKGSCADEFTPQQTARMHCYLDLAYKSWLEADNPSPVPIAPKVIRTSPGSVTLTWVPSVHETFYDHDVCRACRPDMSLLQYASDAWSPSYNMTNSLGEYGPLQARGPPDAQPCEAHPLAWTAYNLLTDPFLFNPDPELMFLELYYQQPVTVKRLWLWVTWNTGGVSRVVLYNKENHTVTIHNVTAFCDQPFSVDVPEDIEVIKVRVYVSNALTSIDALAIQSKTNHMTCKSCDHNSYVISRDPPFNTIGGDQQESYELTESRFIDKDVVLGLTYSYRIHVVFEERHSPPSPALYYTHGDKYCGDGRVTGTEQCDDGNLRDGDGCTAGCKEEQFFHCTGSPSLCYLHAGDGICEEFERRSSPEDCGLFTPEGFEDQWPVEAFRGGQYLLEIQDNSLLGPPNPFQKCEHNMNLELPGLYYVTLFYARPVVATSVLIYLASDAAYDIHVQTVTVELLDINGSPHPTGSTEMYITCRENPVTLNIMHDLSTNFYYTQGVRIVYYSSLLNISAVAVRSYKFLDPLALAASESHQLYSPHAGRLVSYDCDVPQCEPYKVRHGSSQCIEHGDRHECTVTCHHGYKLNNSDDTVTCKDGDWLEEVTCVPITCSMPDIPHARLDCPDGNTYLSRCRFDCEAPSVKIGTESMVQCEADGSWTLPGAYCQVMCPRPSLKNGHVISHECDVNEHLHVGTRCKVTCAIGYRFADTTPKKRAIRMTCTSSGDWVGPECERVTCSAPDPLLTGLYSCTDEFNYKSICTLKCPGPTGAQSVSICEQPGNWDGDFAQCKFEVGSCPDLPNTLPFTHDCYNVSIGSRCYIRCNAIDDTPKLSYSSTVDGKVYEEVVTNLLCTGNLQWLPSPTSLVCSPDCIEEWLNDAYCDEMNNNAFCGWDSGACCPSTVPGGGPVQLPYAQCGQGCACLDPAARENQHSHAADESIESEWTNHLWHRVGARIRHSGSGRSNHVRDT